MLAPSLCLLLLAASEVPLQVGDELVLPSPAPIVRIALNSDRFELRPRADGQVVLRGVAPGEATVVAWLGGDQVWSLPVRVMPRAKEAPPVSLPSGLSDEPIALKVGQERALKIHRQQGSTQVEGRGVVVVGVRGTELRLRGQAPGHARVEVETPRGPRFYSVTVSP